MAKEMRLFAVHFATISGNSLPMRRELTLPSRSS
ncbi:hypothetical protein D2E24_0875 [Bifidobacterium samirii]|uniref:Uncharacterized protein n=1 Tax=Bifidobacterium samirii TaxID=2306974 RepID=A0A430FUZ0_9BIFI|nr:hypothetical protein D2E24_0875 [Bifidobacterium samirii]